MAIININANLNGGDDTTPDNELFYRIYGDVDAYASPIHTTGTAIADADVTVTGDVVDILNVDGTTNTSFKIAAVDEGGNEGILSDAASVSIIVFQDDFAGTTIDETATGWTVTDPADGVTISQNNALIMTSDRTSDVPSTLTNGIESKVVVPNSAGHTVLQFDAVEVLNTARTGTTKVDLRKDGDASYSIGISHATPDVNNTVISVYNSTEVYNFESAVPMEGKTWKIVYKHDTHDIGIYYWNTNVWTQIGVTQNEDISQGGANELGVRIGQNSSGSISTGTFTGQIENVYLSNDNYQTETPT